MCVYIFFEIERERGRGRERERESLHFVLDGCVATTLQTFPVDTLQEWSLWVLCLGPKP